MTLLDAFILGIVEGLTEFLPVSSTGHLILAQTALGLTGPDVVRAIDAYLVVIQLGAVLAVAWFYRARLAGMLRGIGTRGSAGQQLAVNLMAAFAPAALAGFLLGDLIKQWLFSPVTVAWALIVGGVLMIVTERWKHPEHGRVAELEHVTVVDALLVGLAQCFALWPGMSRSMSTIVGAQLRGFTNSVAADFSFLLSLPTLGAAATYSFLQNRHALMALDNAGPLLAAGLVTSFVVAWGAVAWFLAFVKKHGMTPFGAYRIVLGIVTLILISRGIVSAA